MSCCAERFSGRLRHTAFNVVAGKPNNTKDGDTVSTDTAFCETTSTDSALENDPYVYGARSANNFSLKARTLTNKPTSVSSASGKRKNRRASARGGTRFQSRNKLASFSGFTTTPANKPISRAFSAMTSPTFSAIEPSSLADSRLRIRPDESPVTKG
jgi:hypothetical protein